MYSPPFHQVISFGLEELIELVENQLHDLVLEDHVHGDVELFLWSQQRWAKHDGHTLDRHAVLLTMFNHPVGQMGNGQNCFSVNRARMQLVLLQIFLNDLITVNTLNKGK